MYMSVFIGLGTNLGDRLDNLDAVVDIFSHQGVLIKSSSVYETEPWGFAEQPKFLNQVIEINISLEPIALLELLKSIEILIGRRPTFRYGPRIIDLDILFYHHLVFSNERLTIPHPRIQDRAFVLIPMAEIAPDFVHPVFGETIAELSKKVDSTDVHLYQGDRE